jgi:hypothetical protein
LLRFAAGRRYEGKCPQGLCSRIAPAPRGFPSHTRFDRNRTRAGSTARSLRFVRFVRCSARQLAAASESLFDWHCRRFRPTRRERSLRSPALSRWHRQSCLLAQFHSGRRPASARRRPCRSSWRSPCRHLFVTAEQDETIRHLTFAGDESTHSLAIAELSKLRRT